jgi:hypothetical protein
MRRLVVIAAAVGALCLVPAAGVAAAPIHPTPKQVVALRSLTADVTSLVAMTRTIAQGVEVPEKQIVALRRRFVRWNEANRALFGPRLAAVTALGRQGVLMLNAIEQVETVGGNANVQRIAAAVRAFNARVVAFSGLPFAR